MPTDESFIPFQSISQDGYFIISPYNCSHDKAMEDSIPLGAWIMIFFAAYALWAISCIHQRREGCAGCITESLWSLYGYIFDNPSMKEYNWVSRLIALLFSMFSLFIVICYLKNTVTRDRIKMKEQYVYRSYRDIDHALKEGRTLEIIYSQSEFVSSLTPDPVSQSDCTDMLQ